jgi:hypothetical protein
VKGGSDDDGWVTEVKVTRGGRLPPQPSAGRARGRLAGGGSGGGRGSSSASTLAPSLALTHISLDDRHNDGLGGGGGGRVKLLVGVVQLPASTVADRSRPRAVGQLRRPLRLLRTGSHHEEPNHSTGRRRLGWGGQRQ